MPRAFLDANVLFSAAWRQESALHRLWTIPEVQYVTSTYAVVEALRNLDTDERCERLVRLLDAVDVVKIQHVQLVDEWRLPEKDNPIASAAVESQCEFLITGDRRHFGTLMGQTVQGITILSPAEFIKRFEPPAQA
jgi:uncharacterized protein